jgi:hypothetical protein
MAVGDTNLHWSDILVIVAYFAGVLLVGLWVSNYSFMIVCYDTRAAMNF